MSVGHLPRVDVITPALNAMRFLNNKWFSIDPIIVRDNQNACFAELGKRAISYGFDLSTEDLNPPESSELLIFVDVPSRKYNKMDTQKWYLLLQEAPCAFEKNWEKQYHSNFDLVFTWNEDYVDKKKYQLLRFAYDLTPEPVIKGFADRKFLTIIVGAKNSNHPKSLYEQRYDLIEWFSNNHPNDLDLFGVGWPQRMRPILRDQMERYLPEGLKKGIEIFYPRNVVYKGSLSRKREVLGNYKFSICFENMQLLRGFITDRTESVSSIDNGVEPFSSFLIHLLECEVIDDEAITLAERAQETVDRTSKISTGKSGKESVEAVEVDDKMLPATHV